MGSITYVISLNFGSVENQWGLVFQYLQEFRPLPHRQNQKNGGDFLIELKANQPSLRYGVEDRLKGHTPVYSYTEGPELGDGRIETRTYRVFDSLDIIADKEKWGGNMTIIEYESETLKKSSGAQTSEKRLYVSSLSTSTPSLGSLVRNH